MKNQDHAWAFNPENNQLIGLVPLQECPRNPGTFFPKPYTLTTEPGAQPAPDMTCFAESGAWVWRKNPEAEKPAEPTRAELEAGAKRMVDAWALQERDAGFIWNGHTFQSDYVARESLLSIHAGGLGTAFGFWKDAENNLVPDGSAAMVSNLVKAMNARGEEIFARKQAMKTIIPTLTDAQLNNFVPSW